jgi:hypothetical protein
MQYGYTVVWRTNKYINSTHSAVLYNTIFLILHTVAMMWIILILLLISEAANSRNCNETEARIYMEKLTNRDISYLKMTTGQGCEVKFADSAR